MEDNKLTQDQQDELRTLIDLLSKSEEKPDPYDCFPNSQLKEIIYPEFGNIYYLGSVPPYMYKKVDDKWIYVGEASFEGYDGDDLIPDDYDNDEFYNGIFHNRDNLIVTKIYYNKDTEESKRAIDEYILTLPDNSILELSKDFINKCFQKPINDTLIDRIVELRGVEIFESNINQELVDKIRELREEQIFTSRHIKSNQELVDIILESYGLPIWWKEPAIKDERRKAVKKIQTELIQNYGIGIPFDVKEKICLLSKNKAKKLLRSYLNNYIGVQQTNISLCDYLNNNTYSNTVVQIKVKVQEDDFFSRLGRIFYW